MDEIKGFLHINSTVTVGKNQKDESVVELRFGTTQGHSVVVVDRATAARLINQLRRALDQEYNDLLNQRP